MFIAKVFALSIGENKSELAEHNLAIWKKINERMSNQQIQETSDDAQGPAEDEGNEKEPPKRARAQKK